MNLMIVDDHAGMRRMIQNLLAGPGDLLQECGSADEAVRLAAAFHPDCVTMDLRMPGQCAFAATRAIHAAHPAARVVIVTSYDAPDLRQSALAAGAVAYVSKDNLAELPRVLSCSRGERFKKIMNTRTETDSNSMTRLLLVDDDKIELTRLGAACRNAGYQVHYAGNGNEALRIHQENPVDVIVTEMLLPEMDGIELLMALRRQPTKTRIIAMTAGGHFAVEHCLNVAEKLGAHHVLAKPFEPEQLLTVVRALLQKN